MTASQTSTSQRNAISLVTWTPKAGSRAGTVPVSCHEGRLDSKGDLGKQQRRLGPTTSHQVTSSCSSWGCILCQQAHETSFISASRSLGCSLRSVIRYRPQILTRSVSCFQFKSSRSGGYHAELQRSRCSDSIRLFLAELCGSVRQVSRSRPLQQNPATSA